LEWRVSSSFAKASSATFVVDVQVQAVTDTSFLIYNTPWDTFSPCRSFSVLDLATQNQVPYIGKLGKRRPPTKANYVMLHAGQSKEIQVDLSACFQFQENSQYEIRFEGTTESYSPNGAAPKEIIQSTPTKLRSTSPSSLPYLRKQETPGRMLLTVAYEDACTDDQVSVTDTAIQNAITGVQNSYEENLLRGCANSAFSDLFGDYSQDRYSTVLDHYSNIHNRLNDLDFGINCAACVDDGVFAYVYPNDPDHVIYLCPAYWDAGVDLSIDSKPGTLVHELSHFADVAGTSDHIYGLSGARSLADSDPCLAIDNADNHEYYVETMPQHGNDCCDAFSEADCGSISSTAGICAVCDGICNSNAICEGPGLLDSCAPAFYDDCADLAGWYDQEGLTCTDWNDNSDWCGEYSSSASDGGILVSEACCVCGRNPTSYSGAVELSPSEVFVFVAMSAATAL